MKTLLFLMLTGFLFGDDNTAAPAPAPPPIVLEPSEQAKYNVLQKEFSEAQEKFKMIIRAASAELDALRLSVCLRNKLSTEECGKFDSEGRVVRLTPPASAKDGSTKQ